eukprot:Lithocolla_globosa_v1_NODE_1338_length_2660_cov_4.184574.p2 type:complete len:364 gc:universal NODE_1338_length_2660_cov_4.184574:1387-296(-)
MNRQQEWTLGQEEKFGVFYKKTKHNRITLLTTHFMDEADILADYKGILSGGKLACVGTSLFLKNRFGLGYMLVVVMKNNDSHQTSTPEINEVVENLLKCIKPHVEGVVYERKIGSDLIFRLPLQSITNFSPLFRQLQEQSEQLDISSFNVAMTTLEDVFLKMAHVNDQNTEENPPQIEENLVAEKESLLMDDQGLEGGGMNDGNNNKQVSNQYRAKVLTTFAYRSIVRVRMVWFCVTICPITLALIGLIIGLVTSLPTAIESGQPQPFYFTPDLYPLPDNEIDGYQPLLPVSDDTRNDDDNGVEMLFDAFHYSTQVYPASEFEGIVTEITLDSYPNGVIGGVKVDSFVDQPSGKNLFLSFFPD